MHAKKKRPRGLLKKSGKRLAIPRENQCKGLYQTKYPPRKIGSQWAHSKEFNFLPHMTGQTPPAFPGLVPVGLRQAEQFDQQQACH